ncbi:hypothetical protein CANTEDRAFT_137418, partial [Yamadazyma tenuis ATCC 10573]
MSIWFTINVLVIVQFLCAVATADTIGGCRPPSVDKGLYAEYINTTLDEYPFSNQSEATAALSAIDNSEAGLSWGGVTSQNFNFATPADSAVYAELYGKTVNVGYFGLRLSGYFYATTTGDYTFDISNADDTASITLGAGVAMDCCGSGPLTGNLDENAYYIQGSGSTTATETVTLTAGVYYPIKIVYYQEGGPSSFTMSVTYPDDITHTSDIDWYSSTDNSTSCPYSVTTTVTWTGTDTETVTVTGS